MRWIDLLRMSSGNLKRRKLRTFLTILGVIIGTASIVVMISLGLGMQEAMYKQVSQSGGMTRLTVTGKQGAGDGMSFMAMGGMGGESQEKESDKHITGDVVQSLKQLEKVRSANPVLEVSGVFLKGKYMGFLQLKGMSQEALKEQQLELAPGGRLPDPDAANMELVFGNGAITFFEDKTSRKGHWETGELPDIDLSKGKMLLVLDQDRYMQGSGGGGGDMGDSKDGQNAAQTPNQPPKKYLVQSSGVLEGDINRYTSNYYTVFCDIDKLESMLKREFRGRVIPGQPSTKTGKPYKKFVYSAAEIQAENIEDVDELSATIRDMGFRVTTNAEAMDSVKKQFAVTQAVLGGIGAVSLLVAAIGIANTMMMSIYERTKEIGVIKVLGCGLKNIKQMFLMEAAFIGLIGGVVGNILSIGMSYLINKLVEASGQMAEIGGNISYIPLWLALTSMAFAVFVGVAAGYFPALRAMQLSPLAAIRND